VANIYIFFMFAKITLEIVVPNRWLAFSNFLIFQDFRPIFQLFQDAATPVLMAMQHIITPSDTRFVWLHLYFLAVQRPTDDVERAGLVVGYGRRAQPTAAVGSARAEVAKDIFHHRVSLS